MYKIKHCLVYLSFLISFSLYSQQRRVVFNNEGKIVKNYGYDSNNIIENAIEFLIENPDKNNSYYLLFNWRNEYNHNAIIIENDTLYIQQFDNNGFKKLRYPGNIKIPNSRYMNFILVKANKIGSERFKDSISIDSVKNIIEKENHKIFTEYIKKKREQGVIRGE